ncbi:hypothetical protein, partial [Spirosoma panaciterrae]|uniref:hypothetical protein n=1 Tax=Spirosoma panaciterrae TaxID=496058 RepID=UPI000592B700
SPTKQGCKGWKVYLLFEPVSAAISPCGCWVMQQAEQQRSGQIPVDTGHGSTGNLFGSLIGLRSTRESPRLGKFKR